MQCNATDNFDAFVGIDAKKSSALVNNEEKSRERLLAWSAKIRHDHPNESCNCKQCSLIETIGQNNVQPLHMGRWSRMTR
mmetsp:Transcript_19140/g.30442  ORF Transcript_19140/g.30442 Transcript_19140/m.30442 type:complete len:80 (+) Transcript_19140:124-363(+)